MVFLFDPFLDGRAEIREFFSFFSVNSELSIEFALKGGHKVEIYMRKFLPFINCFFLNTENFQFKEQIRFKKVVF